MKKLSVQSLNGLFDYFNTQPSTVLWIRSKDYQRQLYVSSNFEQVWGNSVDILYEHPEAWENFLYHDDQGQAIQEVERRIEKGESLTESLLFYRLCPPKGQIQHIKDDSFILTSEDGQHMGFLGLAECVSESCWHEELHSRKLNQANMPHQQLKKYIFDILKNELRINVQVNSKNKSTATVIPGVNLTDREQECLFYLAAGKTAKETARVMHISARTVEFHLNNVKEKMNCRTKLELLSKAMSVIKK